MAIVATDDKHYKDIADAIRNHTRKGTLYKPSELVDGVSEVYQQGYGEGGGLTYDMGYANGHEQGKQDAYDAFWDTYQENGKRVNYTGAFSGSGWVKATFKPKYRVAPSGSTVAAGMFEAFNRVSTSSVSMFDFSEFNEMFDFSGCSALDSTFKNAQIKNLFVDCSGATSLGSTFNSGSGGGIDNLTLRVTPKTTSFSGTFSYQKSLKELRFTEDSVIAASINFNACVNLTKASIEGIINALSADASAKTLTLPKTAVDNAFETATGAKDGSTSAEWDALGGTSRPCQNWTVSLV